MNRLGGCSAKIRNTEGVEYLLKVIVHAVLKSGKESWMRETKALPELERLSELSYKDLGGRATRI